MNKTRIFTPKLLAGLAAAVLIGAPLAASAQVISLKYTLTRGGSTLLSGSTLNQDVATAGGSITAACSGSSCPSPVSNFRTDGQFSGNAIGDKYTLNLSNALTLAPFSGSPIIGTVEFTVQNLTNPLPVNILQQDIGITQASRFTLSEYWNADNSAFGTGNLIASHTYGNGSSFTSNAFTTNAQVGPGTGAPNSAQTSASGNKYYSFTYIATGTFYPSSGYNSSLSGQATNALPEPSDLGMMGLGLALMGLLGWRYRRSQGKTV